MPTIPLQGWTFPSGDAIASLSYTENLAGSCDPSGSAAGNLSVRLVVRPSGRVGRLPETIVRGDTYPIDFELTGDRLFGAQFRIVAKRNIDDGDGAAVFNKSQANGGMLLKRAETRAIAGQLLLLPADTDALMEDTYTVYDIQLTDNRGYVWTFHHNLPLLIARDVARTAP